MNWPTVALGDISQIISGATPRTSEKRFWDGDVLWATPKDISDLDTPYLDRPPRTITNEGLQSCAASMLPPDSVLLSSRAPIGLVAINRLPVATNQGFKSLVPDRTRLDTKFLYHWLKARTRYLQSLGNGATFKEISKAVVERIEIPLPPLAEQRRIAAILDKADALRRKRKRAIELLDSLTQSIFLEVFGDLTTSVRFPRGTVSCWVSDFSTGKNLAPDPDSKSGGFRVLKVSAVTSGKFDPSESKPLPADYEPPNEHFVRRGDLLFSRANTEELIGATAFVDEEADRVVLPDKIWRFVWNDKNAPNPLFVDALFASSSFRRELSKRATGTSGSMKNISKEKVLQIPVALPTRSEQDDFATVRRNLMGLVSSSRLQHDALNRAFASLQSRAFSGQL